MKTILSLVFSCLCMTAISLQAQQQASINISGQIVDASNQQPIEFATVMVATVEDEQILGGVTTDLDGNFQLDVSESDVYLEVSFLGYQTQTISEFEVVDQVIDLGLIYLAEASQLLGEVVVEAQRSQTEFKLDRRVFHVGQDLSSTGASALEVLDNVPSVNVNIEGEISLRGSTGVQVLINGKPSIMASDGGNALGTITAEMIDRVEVITNPSANYDAEGTSGIINIIIKEDERKGLNGALSVNTGTPHNHSVGLSLNRRTEKFNLFSQLGIGYRELPNDVENINRDLITGTTIFSEGEEFRNETFYNLVLGTDYHINENNVITLSGNFAYEVEDQPSATNFRQEDGSGLTIAEWLRTEVTEATNPKWQYELQYERSFTDHEDHQLLFSAVGSFFGKDQSSEFNDESISGIDFSGEQRTRTNFQEAVNTLKLDYVHPVSEQFRWEAGGQYQINDVSNDFGVSDLINGDWVDNEGLTNIFEFNQKVLALYATSGYEWNRWGIKLGVRMESTDLNTLLINTEERNDQNYTNLFPSAHASYKVSDRLSLQAGYSRRIYRPRLWDLNPFFNIRNSFSIRVGNPNLLPEFTDSYELSSILVLEQASFNFSLYHRYTTDVIERVSIFEDNVNTFKPLNIGVNRATGLEIFSKFNPSRKWTVTGEFNFNYFQREGTLDEQVFDFNAEQWSAEITTKIKLPADFEIELSGRHQSAVRIIQGRLSANTFGDFGLRKKILDGRGALSMGVRDIFATRFRENETDQTEFFVYSRRQRGRFITLGFSFGFGKGETMEYSGQRRRF
ncbi:MAG: TonB-dependent receptor [Bacteroidota bacterium]